ICAISERPAASKTQASDGMAGVDSFIRRYRELPAGYYREFAPSSDLSDFIACGWIKAVRGEPSLIPIIPDGCADIMTFDDGAPFLVGPDLVTRWVPLADGTVITGLRLRPGALQSVFGCKATDLLGESAQLSELSSDSHGLHHRLERLHAPGARLAQLEHWVRGRLARSRVLELGLVSACRALSRDPQVGLDLLAHQLGWNPRMLHRKFVAACGYGPKHLQRILRVQGVLRAAQSGPSTRPLSEIAAALGFADQAHQARDFKSITGFSPTAYLAQSNVEVGRWLEEPWPDKR
ncbi:MAG: helix-turn-helix domain-containing protein, partial [Polyangiaceae bacterium]